MKLGLFKDHSTGESILTRENILIGNVQSTSELALISEMMLLLSTALRETQLKMTYIVTLI